MKLDLNTHFINAYRVLSVTILTAIFSVAVTYAFLVVFYAISSSWAAPVVLSPTQQRVLAFQPQIANLEAQHQQLRYDVALQESSLFIKNEQYKNAMELLGMLEKASTAEAGYARQLSAALSKIVGDKKTDIAQTDKVIKEANALIKSIDEELAAGLITKDQAAQRRLAAQQALNAATDARLRVEEVQNQTYQLRSGASTLQGAATSLQALTTVRQVAELKVMMATLQLEIEAGHKELAIKRVNLSEVERVLNTAKASPYYEALRQPVTVLFVPYDNLKGVKTGEYVYDCVFQVIFCGRVAVVEKVWDAEEYARHPLFKTDLKGKFVSVKLLFIGEPLTSQVVFIGGRPLLI